MEPTITVKGDGTELDYGKQGVTRVSVTYAEITPEENERRLDAISKLAGGIHAENIRKRTEDGAA
ncbi:MAG: hypothetical protein LBN00_06535 [Oscillospiraceae bacterium]|jgi:hypothetical protein|nr:hypothetical protein [Oscillospiraceae bacterium]